MKGEGQKGFGAAAANKKTKGGEATDANQKCKKGVECVCAQKKRAREAPRKIVREGGGNAATAHQNKITSSKGREGGRRCRDPKKKTRSGERSPLPPPRASEKKKNVFFFLKQNSRAHEANCALVPLSPAWWCVPEGGDPPTHTPSRPAHTHTKNGRTTKHTHTHKQTNIKDGSHGREDRVHSVGEGGGGVVGLVGKRGGGGRGRGAPGRGGSKTLRLPVWGGKMWYTKHSTKTQKR